MQQIKSKYNQIQLLLVESKLAGDIGEVTQHCNSMAQPKNILQW